LKKLQDSKYKCDTNITTNGVQIETLTLSKSTKSIGTTPLKSIFSATPKAPGIQFNVWDFGGQEVFHSTHRFFITPNAIYLVLYDMTKQHTIERVKYYSTLPHSQAFFINISTKLLD
jgi:GTPase SAR1 family protein